jgi:hypothetical protein
MRRLGLGFVALVLPRRRKPRAITDESTTRALALLAIVSTLAACTTEPSSISQSVLGTGEAFTVLGGSTVTNTGATTVVGHVGVSPGSEVTGFPPGLVTGGVIHAADAVALQAQADVTTAYNSLAARACAQDMTGQDLGGLTLTSGVYCFSSSAQLTGALTLDAQGDPDALFVFQIGSTLTTASGASMLLINAAQPCNVYWQVGSSATLGTTTSFVGNILALTSISLTTGVQVLGRALARNGAVTMDTNHLEVGVCASTMDGGVPGGGNTDAGPVGGGTDGGGTDGGPGGGDADSGPVGGGADGGGSVVCCVGLACGTTCVDQNVDSINCGGCGNVCSPSEFCSAGTCVGCSTVCGGACANVASDRNNCGECGNVCSPSEYCYDRACRPCGSLCNGGCADLLFDANNCGACGHHCDPDEVCASGACGACATGTACAGVCTDLESDAENCGACGGSCDLGASCVEGACVCLE